MMETSSVALGIVAADAMGKVADVELLLSHSTCPGKYLTLLGGEVAAVKSAIEEGQRVAGGSFVDFFVLPNPHPQIFPALAATTVVEDLKALGIIETFTAASAVSAADVAAKSAQVTLLALRLAVGLGGKSYVLITGEVSAVESAVKAGAGDASGQGLLVAEVVIPAPLVALYRHLL
jgi:microcompartment protein CcmL/EutN